MWLNSMLQGFSFKERNRRKDRQSAVASPRGGGRKREDELAHPRLVFVLDASNTSGSRILFLFQK